MAIQAMRSDTESKVSDYEQSVLDYIPTGLGKLVFIFWQMVDPRCDPQSFRYLSVFLQPFQGVMTLQNKVIELMADCQRLMDLREQPLREDAPDPIELTISRGCIEFHDVDFSWPGQNGGSGTPVFTSFSFRVEGRKLLVLLGLSGSGKSTLGLLVKRTGKCTGGLTKIDRELRDVNTNRHDLDRPVTEYWGIIGTGFPRVR